MQTLVDLVHERARTQGDDRAFVEVAERGVERAALTFGQLHAQAERIAARLLEKGKSGERALLLYESGIEFPLAYFGCLYAGMIPVPVPPPRRGKLRHSTAKIVEDCAPRFAFSSAERIAGIAEELGPSVICVTVEELRTAAAGRFERPAAGEIAHLQYTSGSTSSPKGIQVTHQNVLRNVEQIARIHGNDRSATHVSWLPLYHDMGLVMNLLETVHLGALCVLLEPLQFIHRPLSWLWAIHDYRAQVGGGPNFLYEHCLARYKPAEAQGLDLRCWKVAINGAEPVRADTLERFAATFGPHGFDALALNPCYGMAEATLLVSGGPRGKPTQLKEVSKKALLEHRVAAPENEADCFRAVACGQSLQDERIAIANPHTLQAALPGEVGEIWVAGPHVAAGYLNNASATDEVFHARLAPSGEGPFLRTGDLGFLDGERLYITGRRKDVIIIRGANYYPQDIERTVEEAHPALRPHFSAAFGVFHEGEERLVVVLEVDRAHQPTLNIHEIAEAIRKAVSQDHSLLVAAICLIPQGSIPKTSSGKIQRSLTRQLFLERKLEALASTATADFAQG
jgi:acyl-CoA synthetase (AMP-forming)/AMP-acid ligase II